jgi:hypothetical protein
MERRSRATYSGAHLGRGRLVEVVPRQGTAGGGGWWRRRKWWCWWSKGALLGLEDGVGDGEKTSVLFIGRLRRFEGENISPAVGLAGGGGAWVPAGFPVGGKVTSRAGRWDGSGRGLGRSWWQRLSTRGSGSLRQRGGAAVARGDLPQVKRRLAGVQGSDESRLGPRSAVRGGAGVECWGRRGRRCWQVTSARPGGARAKE